MAQRRKSTAASQPPEPLKRVTGASHQTFQSPIEVRGVATPVVKLSQEPYHLSEAEFMRLDQANPNAAIIGVAGALATYGVREGSAAITKYGASDQSVPWTSYTVWLPACAIVAAIGLGVIAYKVGGGRRKQMKLIRAHFESAPRDLHIEHPRGS